MSIDILNKKECRVRIGKDYSGAILKLTLRKKQECVGKDYDLYTVCKVEEKEDVNGEKELEFTPLYDETFTDKQIEKFYSNPRFHMDEEEEEYEKETTTCVWCGEKNIPVKEMSNARGFRILWSMSKMQPSHSS